MLCIYLLFYSHVTTNKEYDWLFFSQPEDCVKRNTFNAKKLLVVIQVYRVKQVNVVGLN